MVHVGFAESHYESFTGAQQSMLPLLRDAKRYESVLFAPAYGKCVHRFEQEGINTKVVEYPNRLDKFGQELLNTGMIEKTIISGSLCGYYLKVARALRRLNIDVLYCNNVRSVFLFGLPAKVLGLPVIWYVRGDMSKPLFDALAFRIADQIITISDGVRGKFNPTGIDRDAQKFETIYTGVDIRKFDPETEYDTIFEFEDETSINIVQVAKIHPRKQQDNLLKAVGRISAELPDYNIIFAGPIADGYEEYSQSLRTLAADEGIEENVWFLGWCDEIPALLSKTDLFVLPSTNEGFPRSILEAYAMRVPCVATTAGGTAELVDDGITGYLVPIDDVGALSEKICKLSAEPELRSELGRAARKKVKREFTQDKYINNFENFIPDLEK